ncbi:MAG: hypothetical protein BWK78_01715 [Thiotrichaceae bacterium IS1]|nr:MAG: hypothetical protein BWK78_01715 [Thiotrichaceae bacterium IS1]
MPHKNLIIQGAEENNLKQIDVEIPLQQITTIIGVSGSGKSSLIYKVIAEEAKRREKIDSGLAGCRDYAIRPKFDKIENLPYCVVVKQRGLQQSHSSTLATITGLHELLRDEFVKEGQIICQCGAEVFPPTLTDIVSFLEKAYVNKTIELFAVVVHEKYTDCEKEITLLKHNHIEETIIITSYDEKERIKKVKTLKLLNNQHANTIKVYLGSFKNSSQLRNALETYQVIALDNFQVTINHHSYHFKYDYICSACNRLYHPITSSLLSFNANTSSGICDECHGCGKLQTLDYEQLIIPTKQLNEHFLNLEHNGNCYKYTYFCDDSFEKFCKENKIDNNKTFSALTDEHQKKVMHYIEEELLKRDNIKISKFIKTITCPICGGSRLNYKANAVKLYGYSISELLNKTVDEMLGFFKNKTLHHFKIRTILNSLTRATVGYLNLDRSTTTLSGGELQRIKVAIQLNTNYKDLLYILDEPSIGLHAYDNVKFIELIKSLKKQGNTVIISEHNQHYIKNADYLIELGIGGGINGGNVIFNGAAVNYQSAHLKIKRTTRPVNLKNAIHLEDVCCNNIKNQNFVIPLNGLVVISGVSGSGKSSLIHHVLSPIIKQYLADKTINTTYVKSVKHLDKIQSLVELDQSQIGINSRSIIATYIGFFDKIRNIFSNTEIATVLNLSTSAFSFNVEDGQCEYCSGLGEVEGKGNVCPSCLGSRYRPQILEVIYQNLSIADVLNLTIDEAKLVFKDEEDLSLCFNVLIDLGLGHLTLGRTTPTLSGGEGQRLKLAKSLIESKNKIEKGNFFYILDEPTTGLNYEDISKLFSIFDKILKYNNTIIVIEHNLTVIRQGDYVIDMGLGAGKLGGNNIFSGSYAELLKHSTSITAKALQEQVYIHDESPHELDLELPPSKHYSPVKNQKEINNCQKDYLSGERFGLEKYFSKHYSLTLDNDNFNFFKSKEELLPFAKTLNGIKFFAFNPFTIDFFVYKKIARSDMKEKLSKLSQIGFDKLYISGEIYSLKKNMNKIVTLDPWKFKLITDNIEKAYHYGNGWLSLILSTEVLELSARLVSVKHKIIGSPRITSSTFNRYLNPCRECYGEGFLPGVDESKIIENVTLSILEDGFFKKEVADKLKTVMRLEIKPAIKKLREEDLFDFSKEFNQLIEEEKYMFLYGFIHKRFLKPKGNKNHKSDYIAWKGLYFYIRDNMSKFEKSLGKEINTSEHVCPFCHGTGFNKELELYLVGNTSPLFT